MVEQTGDRLDSVDQDLEAHFRHFLKNLPLILNLSEITNLSLDDPAAALEKIRAAQLRVEAQRQMAHALVRCDAHSNSCQQPEAEDPAIASTVMPAWIN